MNAYDLPATSSLVSDDGQPDFVVQSTFADWWEQVDKSDFYTALTMGILIGIVLGIIIYKLYKWFDRKYEQYLEDYDYNKENTEEKDDKE